MHKCLHVKRNLKQCSNSNYLDQLACEQPDQSVLSVGSNMFIFTSMVFCLFYFRITCVIVYFLPITTNPFPNGYIINPIALRTAMRTLYGVLAILSAIGLKESRCSKGSRFFVVLS